jgi:group I intron endonuclease
LEFHVLKVVPKEQLIQEEQILLDLVYGKEGCYNLNPIANSFSGRKHSDATKQRLSELAKGRKHSQETKEKMRSSHTGVPLPENHPIRLGQTPEAKEKIRIAMSGEGNPFFGQTHSDETKEKIAAQLRGKYYGPTTQVIATNKSTGEERRFNSMSAASKNLGIAQSYISLRCAGVCGDTKPWSFEKVEG